MSNAVCRYYDENAEREWGASIYPASGWSC